MQIAAGEHGGAVAWHALYRDNMAQKRTAGALVHYTLPSRKETVYIYITPTGLFCYIIKTNNVKIMEAHDNNTAAAEHGEFGETSTAASPPSNACKRNARITRFPFTVYCVFPLLCNKCLLPRHSAAAV